MAKLRFLKSPTGSPFRLAYSVGDITEIKDDKLVEALIVAKMAETVTEKGGEKAIKKRGRTTAKNKPGQTR